MEVSFEWDDDYTEAGLVPTTLLLCPSRPLWGNLGAKPHRSPTRNFLPVLVWSAVLPQPLERADKNKQTKEVFSKCAVSLVHTQIRRVIKVRVGHCQNCPVTMFVLFSRHKKTQTDAWWDDLLLPRSLHRRSDICLYGQGMIYILCPFLEIFFSLKMKQILCNSSSKAAAPVSTNVFK